jgi:hypothetical protein
VFPAAAFANSTISPVSLLGSWESKQPPRKIQFYIDNTFMVQSPDHVYFRGNWVLYSNRKPLFFVLDDKRRRPCTFLSFRNSLLEIKGHKALAGKWKKTNNAFKMNW